MTEKKPHWTQTPEGREKMSAAQKKHWAKRKNKTRAHHIVKKAVATERVGTAQAFNAMIKLLRKRRDALTQVIATLQEEVRRG